MDGVACAVPELDFTFVGPAPFRPVAKNAEDVLDDAIAWLDAGRRVAIATVIETSGAAPRPVGSQLAVNDRTEFVGSVSSGCVESATVRAALEVMVDGCARRLSFGFSPNELFDVGLTCGGEMKILVECVSRERDLLDALRGARDAHRSVAVATSLDGAEHALFLDGNPPALSLVGPALTLESAVHDAFAQDRCALVERDGVEWFVHVRHPPRRLVIVGAVHIAQALAPMAALNGFDVVLVDPRDAFATDARFPGVRVIRRWPHEVLPELDVDHRTAVVTLAHDTKLDDPALAYAVGSRAFYVGALGSRRSHAARLERLAAKGVSAERLARIHGPVGLPIGAVTTAEIATSIIADMVQTLRRATS
jgi:xanthine dehydrogenase accessory factor